MTKRAIDFKAFNKLSKEHQLEILQKDGVHVGKIIVNGKYVILYQVYGFYAEVYFKEYRREVDEIIVSDNAEILQPYLDQIQITGLDKNKK